MMIHNFDLVGVCVMPAKANPPLVIYSDAVLAFTVAFQRLQPVSRWDQQLSKFRSRMEHKKLSTRDTLDVLRKSSRDLGRENSFGFRAGEAQDHAKTINARRY